MWTPLPESLGEDLAKWFWNPTVKIALWRLLLIGIAALIVYPFLAASLPGAILGIVLSLIVARFWGDDIAQVLTDLWNLDFFRV